MGEFEEYDEDIWGEAGISTDDMVEETRVITAERDQLAEDRRELMKALEELTATCESNHRIAQIGWSYDKYEFAYEAQVSNPVKRARATLDRIKAREGKGE